MAQTAEKRLRAQVSALAEKDGRYKTAAALGVSPTTLRLFLSGVGVRPATTALIEKNLKAREG